MPFQGSSAIMEARIKEYFTEVSARVSKEAPRPKNEAKAVPNVAEKKTEDGGEQGVERKVVAGVSSCRLIYYLIVEQGSCRL